MKLSELAHLLGTHLVCSSGSLDLEIQSACADSRLAGPGCLFCAMKGERADGHDFIGSALQKGAVAILAEHPVALPEGIPCLIMQDSYPALGLVAEACAGNPAEQFGLLAVTGTNGKTTTAYLLRDLWKKAGFQTGMIGTVEYDLADDKPIPADRTTPTPFQLQSLFSGLSQNHAQYASIEISSHALAQRRLGTAQCAAAIFTNLTQDHLDYHHTMEAYFQAKKTLFTDFLKQDAPIVLNCDDAYGRRLARELSGRNLWTFRFGGQDEANTVCSNLQLNSDGLSYDILFPDHSRWHIQSPLCGHYNAANTAGAAIAAKAMGIPQELAEEALAICHGAPGRLQPIPVPGNSFSVFVDYAHTDDALTNVLSCLKRLPHRKLLAVFGCGGDRDRTKRPKMARAAAALADQIIVTSDNPRTEQPEAIIREICTGFEPGTQFTTICNRHEAIFHAIQNAQPGDIILLAGKGHEDYQEINGIKYHFNDAEVALEALKSRG